ncbi:hypothetical protein ACHAW6_000346 [Cyclotella cf. meneghiniana]
MHCQQYPPTTTTTPRNANHTNSLVDEARGDVLSHGFWNQGRGAVFDVHIRDTDSRSYRNTSSSKILEHHAKEEKDKYETACLDQRRDFTPLVYYVDGMASKDTRTAERRIAWLLTRKWSHTYSDMANFIQTRMSLAIVRYPTRSSSKVTVPPQCADAPPPTASPQHVLITCATNNAR